MNGSFPPPTRKQARILWMSATALSVGVLLGLLGLLLWGVGFVLNLLAPVLWPLAVAAVLSYLLDPVVDYFERKKLKRVWAILLTFFLCVLVFLGLLASVVPRLVVEARNAIEEFPKYRDQLRQRINVWISKADLPAGFLPGFSGSSNAVELAAATNAAPVTLAPTNTASLTSGATNVVSGEATGRKRVWETEVGATVLNWFGRVAPRVGTWIWSQASKVASWGGMLVGLSLVPVFTFYFLLEEQSIKQGWKDYLPVQESRFKEEAVFVINSINDYLIVFFRGQVLVAMCDGVLFTIGFLIVGLPYAVLMGFLAGLLSIVPYLGAILTIVPAVVLAIVAFHDWLHPILVVAVFSVVQSLEGLVISPRIMGDRVGLHPLTIIVAVLVGSLLLGGILGGILAIPLTAALRVLMFRYIWKKRH